MKNKNIITIETSLGRIFITIIKNNQIFSKSCNSPGSVEQELNLLIDELMIKADLEYSKIDLILVSLGPGSFTGIRIGISAAKAIAVCTGAKILGFSNFDSIYSQFLINKENFISKNIGIIIKGPGNDFFKKEIINNKPKKKNYLITSQELISEKYNKNIFFVGNFINTFKIKNYFFCLPEKKGYFKLANKVKENFKKIKFDEPMPIYIKEHYAKKK